MAIKKRSNDNKLAIEALANELSDKPYGEKKQEYSLARTTITLPSSLLFHLEDMAKHNKRKKNELRSVSAIIRNCIEKNLDL